ncbi:MAG: phage tail protein [Alphaproteobacteria bacterium]|nr:phage tail protein [Alphaproteobacteria bacterium]
MTIITKKGLEKIAGATADNPLKITHFALGDMSGDTGAEEDATHNEDMESLINEKYRDVISHKYSYTNNITIECVLRATAPITEGFYIREMGLFDEDGDLIVITEVPLQYRPITDGNAITELQFNITLQLDTAIVDIKITEQTVATASSVNRIEEILENIDYVVETKTGLTGTNMVYGWYRKYKSGWVEQGGEVSVAPGQESILFPAYISTPLGRTQAT